MPCSLFSLGSAFSPSKYKWSTMEFSNFLYHLQQGHFPTVKPIIIVTENKTAHEGLTGRSHVRCMRIRCKITQRDHVKLCCKCPLCFRMINPKEEILQATQPNLSFGSTSTLYFSHSAAAHINASWPDDITSSSSCNDMVTWTCVSLLLHCSSQG